jgi:ABC-type Mn2+/Zn2+ transport system permease subunit/Mn-dependent DtxR family transcriptional regulator
MNLVIERLSDVLQYEYAQRALLASGLVGILCGVLGCFIVLRNMALIGDALSHAILPGVVAGFMIAGHSVLAFFVGSVVAGVIAAILITWLQRNVRTKDDAAIGIVFSAMFALGIMGISWLTRREGVHLDMKDFLFGNVLGIADQDLWLTGLITAYALLCVTLFYRYFFITTFQSVVARTIGISSSTIHYFLMLLLSFAVVASLQSVGVILVVAMLIIPASTAYLLTNKLQKMLVIAAIVGVLSTTVGLLLAIVFETTPGPAMTLVGAFFYAMAIAFSPKRGLLVRAFRSSKKKRSVKSEDVLKAIAHLHEQKKLNYGSVSQKLGIPQGEVDKALARLTREGLITKYKDKIELTPQGIEKAYQIIRAHRLWESYLVKEMGMDQTQIHANAEDLEHRLPESFLLEIEEHLEHPKFDPHGSPIPQRDERAENTRSLESLLVGERGIIITNQPDDKIALELWQKGLTPNTPFVIHERSGNVISLNTNDHVLDLSQELAGKVRVTVLNGDRRS